MKGKRAYVANLRYPVNWLIHVADNGVECSDLGTDCKKTQTNVIVTDKITFEADRPNTRFSTARYAVYNMKTQADKQSMRLLLCNKGDKKVVREFMKTLNKEYPLECEHLGMLFDTLRMAAFEYAADIYIVEKVISLNSMKETDYMGNMYLRLFKEMQAEKRVAVAFVSYVVPDARVQFMVIGALITVNGKCFVMDVTDGFPETQMYVEELEKFVSTYIDESFTFLFRGTPLVSSTGLHTRQMRGSAVAAFVNMLILNLVSTTEFSERVENENEQRLYMLEEFVRNHAHLELELDENVVVTYMDYEAIKFVRFGSEMAREMVITKSYITTHIDLWMEEKTVRMKVGEDIHVTFDCEDIVTARSNDIRVRYHTDSIYDKDVGEEVRYSFVGICPFSTRGQEIKWKQERKMVGVSYYSIADDSADKDSSELNWSNTEKAVIAVIPDPARDFLSAFPEVPLRHTRSELPNFQKRHLAVDLLKFRNADKHVITDPKEMSEYILQTNDIRELSVSKPSYQKFSQTRGRTRLDDMNISTVGENESRPIVDIFKEHGIEEHHVKYIPYKHGETAGQVANFLKIAAKRNIGKGLLGAKNMWRKWIPPLPKPEENPVKEVKPPEPAPAPEPGPPRVAPPPSAKVEVQKTYTESAAETAQKMGEFAMDAGAKAAVVAKQVALEKANELSKKFDENVESLMNTKVMEEMKANNPRTLKESEVIVVCRQNIKRWDGDSLCAEELWVYPRDEQKLTASMENDGYGLPLESKATDQAYDPLSFVVPSNATMEDFTETKYEKKMEVRGKKAQYLWSYVDMATSYTRWKTNWSLSEYGEDTKAIANERFDQLTEHIRNEMKKTDIPKNPMLVNDIKIMGNNFGLKWETCKPDATMTELISPGLKILIETRAPRGAQVVAFTREQLKANGGVHFQVNNYIKAKGAFWKPSFDPKDEKAKKVRYAYPNSVRERAEQEERDIDAMSNTLKNIERIIKRYQVKSITEVRREVDKEKVRTHKEEQVALQKAEVDNEEMRKRPNGENLYAGVVQKIREQFKLKLRDLDDELKYLDYVGTVAEGKNTIADIRKSITTAIKRKEDYLSKLSPRSLRVDQAIIICRSTLLPIDMSDAMSMCREELWVYEKKEVSQFAAQAFKTLTETEQDAVNDSWFPAPESFESADQKKNVIYAVDCFCKRKESLSSFMRRAKYDRAMRQRCSKELSVIDRNYFTKDALRGSSQFRSFFEGSHFKSIAVPKYTWVLREIDTVNQNFPSNAETNIDLSKLKDIINDKYEMYKRQGYIDMTDAEFKSVGIPRDWDKWQHNYKIDCKDDTKKEWTMSGSVCKFMEDDLIMNRIFQNFTRNYMLFAEDDSNLGVCFKHYNMARRILDHEEKEMNLIKGQFERLKDVTRGLVLVARIQSLLEARESKAVQFSDLISEVRKELETYAKKREKSIFRWSKKTEEVNLEKLLEELNAYNASGKSPQEIVEERVSAYTEKIVQFEDAYGQPMSTVWDNNIKENSKLMARLDDNLPGLTVSIKEYPDPKKIGESYDPNFLRKVMLIIEFLEEQQFERLSTAKAIYEYFSGTYKKDSGGTLGTISMSGGKRLHTFNNFPEAEKEHPALIFDGYKLWDCQSQPEHDLLVVPFSSEKCALFKGISKISDTIRSHMVKADTKLDMEFFGSLHIESLYSKPEDYEPIQPIIEDGEPKPKIDPIKLPLAPNMIVSPFAAQEMRVAFWSGIKGKNHEDAIKHLVSVMEEGILLTPTPTKPMLAFEKQEFISSMLPAYITNESLKGYRVNIEEKDRFLVVTGITGKPPDVNAMDFFQRNQKYPEGVNDPKYIADKANFDLTSMRKYKFPVDIIKARFADAKLKLDKFKEDQAKLEEKLKERRRKADDQRSENPIYYRGPPGSVQSTPSSSNSDADASKSSTGEGANSPGEEEGREEGGDVGQKGDVGQEGDDGQEGGQGRVPPDDYGPSMNKTTDDPEDDNVLIREFDLKGVDGRGKYSYTISNVEGGLGGKIQFHRVKKETGGGGPSSPILQEIPNIPMPIKDFSTYRDMLKNIPNVPVPGRINKMLGKLAGWAWRSPSAPAVPVDNTTFSCLKHAIVFSTTDSVDMGFDASPLTLKESEVVVVCPENTSIWSPHERCGKKLWVFPIDHVYRLAHAAMVSIRSKTEEVLSDIDIPSPEGYECFRGDTCRSGAKPRSRGTYTDRLVARIGMDDLDRSDLRRLRLDEKKMMIACLATNGESEYGEHLMEKQADDPIQKNLIAFIVKCFKNKMVGPSRGSSKLNVGKAYTRFTPESVRRVVFKTGRWAVWGVKFIYKNPKMVMLVGVAVKIIRILICMWMQGVKYDQCVMFGKILLKRLFGPMSLVYQVAENFLASVVCIAGAVFAILTAQGKTLKDFMDSCIGVVQKIINTLTETLNWLVQQFFQLSSLSDLFTKLNMIFGSETSQAQNAMANIQAMVDNPAQEVIKYVVIGIVVKNPDLILDWVASFTTCAPSYGIIKNFIDEVTGGMIIKPLGHYYKILAERFVDGMLFINNMRMVIDLLTTTVNYVRCWWKVLVSYRGQTLCENDPTCDTNNELNKDPMFAVWNNSHEEKKEEDQGYMDKMWSYGKWAVGSENATIYTDDAVKKQTQLRAMHAGADFTHFVGAEPTRTWNNELKKWEIKRNDDEKDQKNWVRNEVTGDLERKTDDEIDAERKQSKLMAVCCPETAVIAEMLKSQRNYDEVDYAVQKAEAEISRLCVFKEELAETAQKQMTPEVADRMPSGMKDTMMRLAKKKMGIASSCQEARAMLTEAKEQQSKVYQGEAKYTPTSQTISGAGQTASSSLGSLIVDN